MVSGERLVHDVLYKVSNIVYQLLPSVSPVLTVMRGEIETGMRLLGVTSIDQLTPELVRYVDRPPMPRL